MQLPNIYSQTDSLTLINRINQLTPNTAAQWGKMSVAQMLAHCNVSFEMAHNDDFKKSSPFLRFILKNLVKGGLVNDKPLKKIARLLPKCLSKPRKNLLKKNSNCSATSTKPLSLAKPILMAKTTQVSA